MSDSRQDALGVNTYYWELQEDTPDEDQSARDLRSCCSQSAPYEAERDMDDFEDSTRLYPSDHISEISV